MEAIVIGLDNLSDKVYDLLYWGGHVGHRCVQCSESVLHFSFDLLPIYLEWVSLLLLDFLFSSFLPSLLRGGGRCLGTRRGLGCNPILLVRAGWGGSGHRLLSDRYRSSSCVIERMSRGE